MYPISTALLVACLAAAPALADRNIVPVDRQVAELIHQHRVLRQRMGQLQLDVLVAKVESAGGDAPLGRKTSAMESDRDLQRELAAYSY